VKGARKFKANISKKNKVPRFFESYFQKRNPRKEKKARPTKRCVVCYKNNRRKQRVF